VLAELLVAALDAVDVDSADVPASSEADLDELDSG